MKTRIPKYISKFDPSNTNNGKLVAFDNIESFFFPVKRIYYVYDVKKNTVRGHHAHKKLKQVLFCTYGSIKVLLFDGKSIKEVIIDSPDKYLFIGPMVWHTLEWMIDDSVLVVWASDLYEERDYIRDYDEFNERVKYK